MYLHIEYMDGRRESEYIAEGAIRVRAGHLLVTGGDGEQRGYPLHNVRRWWTSDEPAA